MVARRFLLLLLLLPLLAMPLSCATPRGDDLKFFLDDVPAELPPAKPQTPASAEEFAALRDKIRALAREAVEMNKQGQAEQAQNKIDEARLTILNFEGTDEQRANLAEEYDLLLTLLDDLIEPERRTPSDAVRFILSPDPTAQDIAQVEAARSIGNINRYVKGLNRHAQQRVARQLAVFTRTQRGRDLFQRYLDRSAQYRQYINAVLAKNGLPAELLCVSLIESGFSDSATSRAGAVGLWQFMPGTARDYNMQVDRWVDERLDWMKATHAAAAYFNNSMQRYNGNIELSVASYNTGPGNVNKAIRRAGGRLDYWRLKLHPETMDYVPKWIAAMILYYNPRQHGFIVPKDDPPQFDEITIRGSIELETIAQAVGEHPKGLYALNRALIRKATPPARPWKLRLPAGSRDKLLANLDDLLEKQSVVWIAHRVVKGDSPASIAKMYAAPLERVVSANDLLDRSLPEPGEVIMVPVSPDNQTAMAQLAKNEARERERERQAPPSPGVPAPAKAKPKTIVHKVRLRDNLWTIAQRYDVSVGDLRQWNKNEIGAGDQIRPGQNLTIVLDGDEPLAAPKSYTVKRGDTLSQIAPRQGVTTKALGAANNLTAESTIYPGMTLKLPQGANGGSAQPTAHIVQRGETLSGIAERYGLMTPTLMKINKISNPRSLRPGQTLLLSAPKKATVHTVKRGETLGKIAQKYGVSVSALAKENKISIKTTLRVGQQLRIPAGGKNAAEPTVVWISSRVKPGDNLTGIARRFGCSVDELAAWNKIKRTQPLRVGQVLKVKVRKSGK